MTVYHNVTSHAINIDHIIDIANGPEYIASQIAKQAIASSCDTIVNNLELKDELTKEQIEIQVNKQLEQIKPWLESQLEVFTTTILNEVGKYSGVVKVKRIEYDDDGKIQNISVNLTINS